jgi:hypothetical protein
MATRALLRPTVRRDEEDFDFAEAVDDEWRAGDEQDVAAKRSLMDYAELMPEPGIGALRFDDFPFQVEWYSDEVANADECVWAKGAQVGASGAGIRWVIRQVDQFGDTGLYVMPTDEVVEKFSDERVEPAIEESPYLLSKIKRKWVRNKKHKRINRGFLHMRGSNSKAGAQSVAAQFLFLDERDLLDQGNVEMIMRRVSGAVQIGKRPKIRHAGYPLIPNDGIDLLYRQSDQRVWHVTCPSCGEEQPITWEENVRWTMPGTDRAHRAGDDEFEDRKEVGDVWRQCRSCEASLEDTRPGRKDGALRTGRWIAKFPERDVIGFHVWRGMVPVTDLKALVVASRGTKETDKEAFAALDLGRPYSSGQQSLSDGDLARACGFGIEQVEAYYGANVTTMGVDVAGERDLNVQIDEQLPPERAGMPNRRRALWIGRVSSFEGVVELMVRFRVLVCAIDSNPERRAAKALRAAFPGRVVLVEYDARYDSEPLILKSDEAGVPLIARVNRTDAIDGMMDSVRQVRWMPLATPPPGWMAQMKALHRKSELNKKGTGIERHYVTTGTDGDDFAHAATYGLVATELWRANVVADERIAAGAGTQMSDEDMGFRRVRLSAENADSYSPGLGEHG